MGLMAAWCRRRSRHAFVTPCWHARIWRATVSMSTSPSELHSAFGRAGRHVMVALDGIRFSDPDAAATQPTVWVDAFRLAIAQGRPVSHAARTCIQENLQRCSADDFVASDLDRKALLDLLSP